MAPLAWTEQLIAFQSKLYTKAVHIHSAVDPRSEKEKEAREAKSKLVVMDEEEEVGE